MKTVLTTATILSWFNIIFWGLIDGLALLGGLFTLNLPVLAGAVLLSAVPLNCYAALKLHASIRLPTLPLSHQTPAGIRFVGFIALFFGITWIVKGVSVIKDSKEALESMKEMLAQMPQLRDLPQSSGILEKSVRLGGVAVLILGLCVVVNVVLNLRLLRWYYLVGKSDVS